jgi:ferric-dicitrate binding protein FerR (iron transport regulator)
MRSNLRRSLTLCLVAAVSYACSPHAAATAGDLTRTPAGELVIYGHVLLDGFEAVSGVTFFSGSEVQTGAGAGAFLGLGALGRAELRPQSALRVGLGDDEVSATLGGGGVRLSKPEGVAACVATGSGSVVADREGAAVFTVKYEAGRTSVETQSGMVRLRLGGKEIVVGAGGRYAEGQGAGEDEVLTGKQKAGIIAAIGGGIALLIIILTTNGDEEPPPALITPAPTPTGFSPTR